MSRLPNTAILGMPGWLVKHKLQRSPGTLGPALRELQAVAVTEAKDALL